MTFAIEQKIGEGIFADWGGRCEQISDAERILFVQFRFHLKLVNIIHQLTYFVKQIRLSFKI